MEKLTIIGGSGYLGRSLIARLQGYAVTTLDRAPFPENHKHPENFKTIVGDALDSALLARACQEADIVWIRAGMLGGQKSADIRYAKDYLQLNTELTHSVLKVCDSAGCTRVLYDSSEQVFGTSADQEAHTPECEPSAPNFYGASKAIAEKILRRWAQENPKRSVQVFRYSRVRDAQSRDVLRAMAEKCLAGLPITIVGDANHHISFIHLDDVLAANEKALQRRPSYAVYNLSCDRPYSLRELAERTQQWTECRVPVEIVPPQDLRPFEPPVVGMEWKTSAQELGYSPRWTVDLMIQETIQKAGH